MISIPGVYNPVCIVVQCLNGIKTWKHGGRWTGRYGRYAGPPLGVRSLVKAVHTLNGTHTRCVLRYPGRSEVIVTMSLP